MSSTNKTTYYELPQFVDNDIFNPLVDDNDAYSKIDTALHNIANAEADDASDIVSIKSRLDSAEGDIDTLEAQNGNNVLKTTAQTLSGAVNELDDDTSALDGRLDIVEDDINNVSTGLKAKVTALETQNGNEVLTTTAQTLSGAVNELFNRKTSYDMLNDAMKMLVNNGLGVSKQVVVNKSNFISQLVDDDVNSYSMQGGAYNSINNQLMLMFLDTTNANVKLVLISGSDFTTVIARNDISKTILGHANGATFNPNTNKFYVACADSTGELNTANKVAVINPTTLVFEEYKTLSPSPATADKLNWHITYDSNNNCYYTRGNSYIQKYDADFNFVSEMAVSQSNPLLNIDTNMSSELACGCYFMGYYAVVAWHRTRGLRNGYTVVLYNPTTGAVFTSWTVNNNVLNAEPECAFVKDGMLYIVSGQQIYNITRLIPQNLPAFDDYEDNYGGGITLPDNTDINTIITTGKYFIHKGHGITNTCWDENSILIVMNNAIAGELVQLQLRFDGGIFDGAFREFENGAYSNYWQDIGNYYSLTGLKQVPIHINSAVLPVAVHSQSKGLYIQYPLCKSPNLLDASKLTVTGTITVRFADGKRLSNGSSTNLTIETDFETIEVSNASQMIRINLANSTALVDEDGNTITNNGIGVATGNFYLRVKEEEPTP